MTISEWKGAALSRGVGKSVRVIWSRSHAYFSTLARFLWPPHCLGCDAFVLDEGGLCPDCWTETVFLTGPVCDSCARALPDALGFTESGWQRCDRCRAQPPPWDRARAALAYQGAARRIVLGLKYDRFDLLEPAGRWLARAALPLLEQRGTKGLPDTVIVPVPLHRSRLFQRRYNQSANLAWALARELNLTVLPDALQRPNPTPLLAQLSWSERRGAMKSAIHAHPKRGAELRDKRVLLLDDVLTSGATLAACTQACREAGAERVDVLILARAAPVNAH